MTEPRQTRTIGLLGGMSWESTQIYYRLLNQGIRARLGGLHSARLVMHSVNFAEIERLQHRADWDGAARLLGAAARSLAAAGADFLVIATNTMHKLAAPIEATCGLPLLHIADATANALLAAGHRRVGLLGTRFTMEQDFYRGRLAAHGLEVVVPEAAAREIVHRVIYDELCQGQVFAPSRERYRATLASLADAGATAVILGCTEISLLVGPADSPLPLFDTTEIHAAAAVAVALGAPFPAAPH